IARKRAAEALRAEQVFLASMLQSLQEGILACDADGNRTLYNEAMLELQGREPSLRPTDAAAADNLYEPDGVTPLRPEDLPLRRALLGERVRDTEVVIGRADQRRRTVIVNGQAVHDDNGKKLGAVIALHDVTDRKQVEDELARRTFRDTLTGLPNRALFMDRVAHALRSLRPGDQPAAVFAIGIDNFKLVNDSLGHEAGNQLLIEMGNRLLHVVGPSETVARLGGDVFGVLCEQVTDEQEALHLAQLLREAIALPQEIEGRQLQVTATIGITLLNDPDLDPSTAQSHADSALSRAKSAGRGGIELFGEDLRGRAIARLEIEHDLRRAIEREELVVHYQPKLRLTDGRIVAAEALLRWDHGGRGLVSPGQFIPVAEETGLIVPIGQWVLEQACRSAAAWATANPEDPVMVSVNLSARQLAHRGLVKEVGETLAMSGVDPSLICLEITESVLMDDAEASVRDLRALKALGVRLAVDDFGTGYSSLSYLKRFPVDFLKVDRSFVEGLGRDPEDTAIVSAIVKLARALGLAVVAEGVETELQLVELQRLDCEYGQGFFWSKAITEPEVGRLLAARPAANAAVPVEAPTPVESGEGRPPGEERRSGGGGRRADDAVAFVAHELRAPLTVISGYAELLAEDLGEEDGSDSQSPVQTIMRNARHMADLIDTLADVGAIDAGRLSLDLRPCEVTELVRETVADIAPALDDHPVEVTSGAPGDIAADRSRLRQVITNLLTNAAKFSPAGALISVHVEADGGVAKVSVVDRGPGVPPEAIGDVFRKFARVDRSRPGRGLG
ncbi:MAG: EAL domain-containing protein, partial [Actinobacteria bacterium]|nr:EAL domain-containing protein [Actinomycetota bacterium]